MPYKDPDKRRAQQRVSHRRAYDEQCDAITAKGTRCNSQGIYDGYHAKVLCDLHFAAAERDVAPYP
jgi:hypothetical protein